MTPTPRLWFRVASGKPLCILTANGKVDLGCVSEKFGLTLSSLLLNNLGFPTASNGLSHHNWQELMAAVGDPNGSSANDAIVVTGNPAIVPAAVFTPTIHLESILQSQAADSFLLSVNLKNPKAGKGCQASLLFDKGFDGDILLTAHKAAQLEMEPAADSRKWRLWGANGAQLSGRIYGYVECCLIFETSDGNTVKNESRVAPLEILVLDQLQQDGTGSRVPLPRACAQLHHQHRKARSRPPPTPEGEMSAFNLSFVDDDIVDDEEAPSEMLKHLGEHLGEWTEGRFYTRAPLIVEVLKRGGRREGYNALLGLPAMRRLGVGVNPVTHRICNMVMQATTGYLRMQEIRPHSNTLLRITGKEGITGKGLLL